MNLERAIAIAIEAHKDQVREGGESRLSHVIHVLRACRQHGRDAEIVAALHDVVEDSPDWPLARLREEEGFHPLILEAVDAITRRRCGACASQGRVPNEKEQARVRSEVMALFPGMFWADVVDRLALIALGRFGMRACADCGGSGLEPRGEYIARVKANELARLVKIEDARHNRDNDTRRGMRERYTWVLEQLDADADADARTDPRTCLHTWDLGPYCERCGSAQPGFLKMSPVPETFEAAASRLVDLLRGVEGTYLRRAIDVALKSSLLGADERSGILAADDAVFAVQRSARSGVLDIYEEILAFRIALWVAVRRRELGPTGLLLEDVVKRLDVRNATPWRVDDRVWDRVVELLAEARKH